VAAERRRSEPLLVRLDVAEKEAFRNAADLAGVPLSAWVRERLRQIATKELTGADRPIAFLRKTPR
jgi:predicted HicB family RNase H-like nuclease